MRLGSIIKNQRLDSIYDELKRIEKEKLLNQKEKLELILKKKELYEKLIKEDQEDGKETEKEDLEVYSEKSVIPGRPL